MISPADYRNLIFDLGGVLYATDTAESVRAFLSLSDNPGQRVDPQVLAGPPFTTFEMGLISPGDFRDQLRSQFGLSASGEQIDTAWNALLKGVIPGRVELLQRILSEKRIVLLSNTNQIHYDAFAAECSPMMGLFRNTYFSFRMGLRKPAPEIYQAVLQAEGWEAGETALIDDNEANVIAARKMGMGGLLYTRESDWQDWFPI